MTRRGEVTATAAVPPELLEPDRAAEEVARLVGERDQVPPRFSAVSVGGRRAYDAARAGEELELSARHVTIHAAMLVGVRPDERSWVVGLGRLQGHLRPQHRARSRARAGLPRARERAAPHVLRPRDARRLREP